MKRLIKKSANEYVYKFKSPITININDEHNQKTYSDLLSNKPEFEDIVKKAVNESMESLGPRGLVSYASYYSDGLTPAIISIIVTVENCEAITIVKFSEKLDETDLARLKDYITRQFSDGWGKHFEPLLINEPENSYDNEIENKDTFNEPVPYFLILSVNFWNNKNWNIKEI